MLLRLLELPAALFDREGTTSLIVFDEIQDVLAVPGADGKIRSVIQHQADAATYAFAGSAPGVMQQLFADPKRPLLDQAVPSTSPRCRSRPSATTSRSASQQTGARRRRRAGAAARVHARAPTAQHDAGPLPVAAHSAGAAADEGTWVSALDQAATDTAPLMRAIWRALTTNERRVARALAVTTTPLHSEETAAAVGIKRSSIGKALESLIANADVIDDEGRPRLTDPMFELWLQTRGLTPAGAEDRGS